MLPSMRPSSLYPLLAASLLSDDFQDLLLLSFLGAMEDEEEEYEEGSGVEDEWDDEDEDDDDEEEDEEEEDDEEESEYEESDDEDESVEPVPAKRRHLSNILSQGSGAGTSTESGSGIAVLRHTQNPSQPGSTPRNMFLPIVPTVTVRRIPHAVVSPRPVQQQPGSQQNSPQLSQQRVNSGSSQRPNLHSRSQQVQTDSQENGVSRPLVNRELLQHNLPQARVVLRLPNDIGDMYPREE